MEGENLVNLIYYEKAISVSFFCFLLCWCSFLFKLTPKCAVYVCERLKNGEGAAVFQRFSDGFRSSTRLSLKNGNTTNLQFIQVKFERKRRLYFMYNATNCLHLGMIFNSNFLKFVEIDLYNELVY